jgi:hypothetical protein
LKGLVFTEFLEMVDARFSLETSERILEMSDLPSGGIYTSVGTYDFQEMASLVVNLSRETGIPAPDLLQAFGRHLFARFLELFPNFFEGIDSAFDFLSRINGYVHIEVKKLYPDAELPLFDCEREGADRLVMTYRSSRDIPDLAEGLIRASLAHYGKSFDLSRESLGGNPPATRFVLTAAV